MKIDSIFNTAKTPSQYAEETKLFLGNEPGLLNSIHKPYPRLWELYKTMKSLDWSEDEFDYTQCNLEFKTCPKSTYNMMIKTLAWQWEADSVASRLAPIMAPFISDSTLWIGWQRIFDNESIHALTYSEIVRMSFDNPEEVLKDILAVKESLSRLTEVAEVFANAKAIGCKITSGEMSRDDPEAYDAIFMVVVALFMLERIQFMASFAITFTICETGLFQPIGKAVQKIAQDELEVHVEFDKEVLRIELQTQRCQDAFKRLKPKIDQLFNAIVQNEHTWLDYCHADGDEIPGSTNAILKNWVLFSAAPVAKFLNIDTEFKFPKNNPMIHLEDWINIGKSQAAPQEQDNNQYKVGVVIRDDEQETFDDDF